MYVNLYDVCKCTYDTGENLRVEQSFLKENWINQK